MLRKRKFRKTTMNVKNFITNVCAWMPPKKGVCDSSRKIQSAQNSGIASDVDMKMGQSYEFHL